MISTEQIAPGDKVRCIEKTSAIFGQIYTIHGVAPLLCSISVEEVFFYVANGKMYPHFPLDMFELIHHNSQNSKDAWDRAMKGV